MRKYENVRVTKNNISNVIYYERHKDTYKSYVSWLRFLALIREYNYNVQPV